MTLRDFWNAVKSGFNARGDLEKSIMSGDFARDGGFYDQYMSGDYIKNEGRYVDEGQRALAGIGDDGSGALEAYSSLVSSGAELSPEVVDALNNKMNVEATNSARDFEEHMRDTDLISSAQQLSSFGVSPATLAGSVANHSGVQAPSVGKSNPALDRYNRKMAVAQSLVGLVGSMANSGIYGANMIAAKKVAGQIALNAAHSAKKVTAYHDIIGDKYYTKTEWTDWNI